MRGTVDRVVPEAGFGFLIGPNGEEYFFHRSGLAGVEFEELGPGVFVEFQATEEAGDIEKSLARWLWVLETIVTAAPLLGLLGTISGMIRSFKLFGQEGLVDPRGVTGGVAEALIATAVGLFIALIALFAFNFFSYRQTQVMDEMEQLGTRLVDAIRLQEEKKQS